MLSLLLSCLSGQVQAEAEVDAGGEEVLELEVRLVEATPMPSLQRIAPYREALATALYEVIAVRQGRFEGDRLLVARWVIVDRQPVPGLSFKPGTVEILRLVRMDQGKEFRNRLLLDETGRVDLVLYVPERRADVREEADGP